MSLVGFYLVVLEVLGAKNRSSGKSLSGRNSGSKIEVKIINISGRDQDILGKLIERKSEIASNTCHAQKKRLWQELNDLKPRRPMVWINEIPWGEMEVNNELQLRTEDPLLKRVEKRLRRQTYKWEHMPADMVVEDRLRSPLVIQDSGYGIKEGDSFVLSLEEDPEEQVDNAANYENLIESDEDLKQIEQPQIVFDKDRSKERFKKLKEIAGDTFEVEKKGLPGFWWAPWDMLVTWYGVEDALRDLIKNPDLLHAAMERLVNVSMAALEELEEKNLLASNNSNVRVGSGGYGYTTELPEDGESRGHVGTRDIWGMSAAQIFSEVSEEMHEEFALNYEKDWLEEFGLTYYGCCEPLHNKMDIMKELTTLRKVSMSPWADYSKAAQEVGNDLVISYKPNPSVLAKEEWDPELARRELRDDLAELEGCPVEVIMKDISTVRNEPYRLWEWESIAMEEIANLSG